MTMLAYYIKPVLELVPEAMPMVKQASLTEELPIDGRSSTVASALAIEYMVKVAHVAVSAEDLEKVAKAITMYSLEDEVGALKTQLVKRANIKREKDVEDSIETHMSKQAYFEGELSGNPDIGKIVEDARSLYKEANLKGVSPSDEVIRYSGNGYLNKEAALRSLSVRYTVTKEPMFIKLAKALGDSKDAEMSKDILSALCEKVSGLDKTAGLHLKGFNFYKEVIMTKEAEIKSSMYVTLMGTKVPFEKIERVGKARITSYIGKDVAAEMDAGPANFKQVLETLPRDLQQVMVNLTKNV